MWREGIYKNSALSYTMYHKRNVKLGWFKMRQQNTVVCEPNFTNMFVFDVESIIVVNAFSCFSYNCCRLSRVS